MKNILESQEVFEAYANIDMCYYLMKELINNQENNSLSFIDILVDQITGYGKYKNEKSVNEAIELLESIISSKKIIGADIDNDLKIIDELKQFLK